MEFSANPFDVDSSLKLMDHSWLTNDYLNLFIKRLKEKPARVVWAGDYGRVIHPLPLLTANSNGRGGGDYHYENKYIGTWYADVIGATDELPTDIELTEIIPNFFEK